MNGTTGNARDARNVKPEPTITVGPSVRDADVRRLLSDRVPAGHEEHYPAWMLALVRASAGVMLGTVKTVAVCPGSLALARYRDVMPETRSLCVDGGDQVSLATLLVRHDHVPLTRVAFMSRCSNDSQRPDAYVITSIDSLESPEVAAP